MLTHFMSDYQAAKSWLRQKILKVSYAALKDGSPARTAMVLVAKKEANSRRERPQNRKQPGQVW